MAHIGQRWVSTVVGVAVIAGAVGACQSKDSPSPSGTDGSAGLPAGEGGSTAVPAGGGGSTAVPAGEGGSAGTRTGGGQTAAGKGGARSTGGAGVSKAGAGGESAVVVVPSDFECSDLGDQPSDASSRDCFDFSDSASASSWVADGGTWTLDDGGYVGTGPSDPVTCPDAGSLLTASVLEGFSAADVRVHVKMTALVRSDKVIVLRSRDSRNRIELNFRAYYEYEGTQYGGDLIIQELVDCEQTIHVDQGEVSVPHEIGEAITADIELRGNHFTVSVDEAEVFDADLSVATDAGGVGFAVITDATTLYDDFVIEALQ